VNVADGGYLCGVVASPYDANASRGAAAREPQLWLYAGNDSLYEEALIRDYYYQAFIAAGGSALPASPQLSGRRLPGLTQSAIQLTQKNWRMSARAAFDIAEHWNWRTGSPFRKLSKKGMSGFIFEPQRTTAILREYDVIVLTGGPAGLTAAGVPDAPGTRFGRIATGGTNFCGPYANVHGEHVQIVRGIADELLGKIDQLGGLNRPDSVLRRRRAGVQARGRRTAVLSPMSALCLMTSRSASQWGPTAWPTRLSWRPNPDARPYATTSSMLGVTGISRSGRAHLSKKRWRQQHALSRNDVPDQRRLTLEGLARRGGKRKLRAASRSRAKGDRAAPQESKRMACEQCPAAQGGQHCIDGTDAASLGGEISAARFALQGKTQLAARIALPFAEPSLASPD
jgi:hypothetical protein